MRPGPAAALLAAALGAAPAAHAAFSNEYVGTSGGQFLKLAPDARSAGMGGAMGAAAEDPSSLHWNPAGLAGLEDRQVSLTHASYYQSVYYDHIAFGQPIRHLFQTNRRREMAPSGLGTLAFALTYLNAGPLSTVDNTGKGSGGSFTPSDMAVAAAWGGPFSRMLDLGVGVKYVRAHVTKTVSTAAVDFGARLKLRYFEAPIVIAASGHNLGGHLRFDTQLDPLPATYRVGGSVRPFPFWLIASDFNFPRDNDPYPSVGTELSWAADRKLTVAGRAGYNGLSSTGELDGLAGVAFGGGARFVGLGVDYAWVPFGALGDSHRFTLSYRF